MDRSLSLQQASRRILVNRLEPFRPVCRAYALGLASVAIPRILSLCLAAVRNRLTLSQALGKALEHTKRQISLDRFPAACALLVFGATWLPNAVADAYRINRRARQVKLAGIEAVISTKAVLTFLSSFVAALVSFSMLNRRESKGETFKDYSTPAKSSLAPNSTSPRKDGELIYDDLPVDSTMERETVASRPYPLAGRTMDLTIFALCRASDVCMITTWHYLKAHHTHSPRRAKVAAFLAKTATPTLFATTSFIIMWSWFYSPHSLPASYNTWISSAAQIDPRLIDALRQCRQGTFVYGVDTGRGPLLEAMATDLNYPTAWGNPAKTIPIPCELYHSGAGPNCEWHAMTRFARAWAFAMRMYAPLNLLILLRRKPTRVSIIAALISAARSSTFLGAFVALFYYGVCLGRTRLGPALLSIPILAESEIRKTASLTPAPNAPTATKSAQYLESGPAVTLGALLCGWSILLEKPPRRQEIAFFTAPRAVATLFPRRYGRECLWRERVVFAASVGVILTAVRERPGVVRGVLGRVLEGVFGA